MTKAPQNNHPALFVFLDYGVQWTRSGSAKFEFENISVTLNIKFGYNTSHDINGAKSISLTVNTTFLFHMASVEFYTYLSTCRL